MKISDYLKQETKKFHQISETLVINYIRNMNSEKDYTDLLKNFYVFNKEIHRFYEFTCTTIYGALSFLLRFKTN